jgi:hypothetical protein
MSAKVGKNFAFTEEEKEKWLDKYFKKYYMENQELDDITVRMKLDTDQAAKKRTCSCTVGVRDEKTGVLVPPCDLHAAYAKPDKYITVKLPQELATREMKDAQLGMSAGIKSKLDDVVMNDELDNLLAHKLKTITAGKSGVKFETFNQILRQS